MDSGLQSLLACIKANNAEIGSLTERYKKEVAKLEKTNDSLLASLKADILVGKKVFGTPMENLLFLWTHDIELPGRWLIKWFEDRINKTARDFLLVSSSWQENCFHGGPGSNNAVYFPKTGYELVLLKDDPIKFDFEQKRFYLNFALGGTIDSQSAFKELDELYFDHSDFFRIISTKPVVEPIGNLVLCKEFPFTDGEISKKFSCGSGEIITTETKLFNGEVLKKFAERMNLHIDWESRKITTTESLLLSL